MVRKLRDWLRLRYLPRWAASSLAEENDRLKAQLASERQQNAALKSYIQGMQAAIRIGKQPVYMKRGESIGTDQGAV